MGEHKDFDEDDVFGIQEWIKKIIRDKNEALDNFILEYFSGDIEYFRSNAHLYVLEEDYPVWNIDDLDNYRATFTWRIRMKTPEELEADKAREENKPYNDTRQYLEKGENNERER